MVGRLCEPIEGLDSAHLAEWLGLDPSSYIQRGGRGRGEEEEEETNMILPQEKSDPLFVPCPTCGKVLSFHYTGKKVRGKERETERDREGERDRQRERINYVR